MTRRDLREEHRELVARFRAGEERALARAISLVENEQPGFEELLDALHEGVGGARRIGVTGPPGVGKSTLTAALARRWRGTGDRVGVLAVDPTSPFSGGALLGDRIRMSELAAEPGIFIRSMATRGSIGGLATSTREAADLLDVFGFDRILVETVGVGQSELEIAGSADTTLVVLVPESGDAVQAMKAGLMEVADVFAVNKADRPGAARIAKELRVMLDLRSGRAARGGAGHHGPGRGRAPAGGEMRDGEGATGAEASGAAAAAWEVPVLECAAGEGRGIGDVGDAVDAHFDHLETSGGLRARRRRQRLEQARAVLLRRAERRAEALWDRRRSEVAERLDAGGVSPYRVALELAAELGGES